MAKNNEKVKSFFKYTWTLVKTGIPSAFMYFCASMVLMMICMKGEAITWDSKKLTWTAVMAVAAGAYNAIIMWANGGSHYEMLVSGNIKRTAADAYGNAYKMSSHQIAKEYRDWKGFVIGAIIGALTFVAGIIFAINQDKIDGGLNGGALGATVVILLFLCGWALLPFYCYNAHQITMAKELGTVAVTASYAWACLFALLPVLVSGGFYIWGAYARRNKAVREQMLADRAAQAEAQREKKINYGGLPGTKPKKRK